MGVGAARANSVRATTTVNETSSWPGGLLLPAAQLATPPRLIAKELRLQNGHQGALWEREDAGLQDARKSSLHFASLCCSALLYFRCILCDSVGDVAVAGTALKSTLAILVANANPASQISQSARLPSTVEETVGCLVVSTAWSRRSSGVHKRVSIRFGVDSLPRDPSELCCSRVIALPACYGVCSSNGSLSFLSPLSLRCCGTRFLMR